MGDKNDQIYSPKILFVLSHDFNQIRISSKNPYLPPDLEKIREEEAKQKAQDDKEQKEKEEEAKKERTQDKINTLKEKLAHVHKTSPEIPKLKKQIEDLQVIRDSERLLEIQEELKGLPRYGPEAAALKLEQEEIEERTKARKEAEEEARKVKEAKNKNDKSKTNKARDDKSKESVTRKSSTNVWVAQFLFVKRSIKF